MRPIVTDRVAWYVRAKIVEPCTLGCAGAMYRVPDFPSGKGHFKYKMNRCIIHSTNITHNCVSFELCYWGLLLSKCIILLELLKSTRRDTQVMYC